MFSHFSPAAQAVVHLAEQECRNADHYYLGTEHLLLAMAIAPPADVGQRFAQLGVEPWEVKRALRSEMDLPAEHPWEGVVITPRVLKIFAKASEDAEKRSARVEPADLLRAIIDDGAGVAARTLTSLCGAAHRAPSVP